MHCNKALILKLAWYNRSKRLDKKKQTTDSSFYLDRPINTPRLRPTPTVNPSYFHEITALFYVTLRPPKLSEQHHEHRLQRPSPTN